MNEKHNDGAPEWADPDDAPELTDDFFDRAELFQGTTPIKRGPGRPRAATTKEQVTLRLDPNTIERWRATGPGWQTRINAAMTVIVECQDRIDDMLDAIGTFENHTRPVHRAGTSGPTMPADDDMLRHLKTGLAEFRAAISTLQFPKPTRPL